MKINLLKIIRSKNIKLKTKVIEFTPLDVIKETGYNENFVEEYSELEVSLTFLIESFELDIPKQRNKANNNENLFKVVTKSPLFKKSSLMYPNLSITYNPSEQLNDRSLPEDE